MVDTRSHFHQEIQALEDAMMESAERAEQLAGMATVALVEKNMEMADRVEEGDLDLDATYFDVHNKWLNLMARQQPMGGDLRLMSAILHLNVTLERMGDQCVNIAKLARQCEPLPVRQAMIDQIQEMGDLVRPMIRTAAHAFIRRDTDEASLLPAMDDPVDRINRDMYREVVACGADPRLLEWATHVMMASRAYERIGDQSVDIGEQVVFLITGEVEVFNEKAFPARDRND